MSLVATRTVRAAATTVSVHAPIPSIFLISTASTSSRMTRDLPSDGTPGNLVEANSRGCLLHGEPHPDRNYSRPSFLHRWLVGLAVPIGSSRPDQPKRSFMVGRAVHPHRFSRPDRPTIGPAVSQVAFRSCYHFWRIVISRLQTPHTWLAPRQRAELMPRTSHPAVRGVHGWSVGPPPNGLRRPDRPTITLPARFLLFGV